MRIEIQLRIVDDDNSVISADEVLHFDKSDDRVEAIGLSFGDAKAVLGAIQERVVTAQAASFLARHRCCNRCGRGLLSKGPGLIPFRTYYVVSILSHHPTLMLVEYCWCSSLPRHRTTMDSRPGAGAWRGSANRAEGLR